MRFYDIKTRRIHIQRQEDDIVVVICRKKKHPTSDKYLPIGFCSSLFAISDLILFFHCLLKNLDRCRDLSSLFVISPTFKEKLDTPSMLHNFKKCSLNPHSDHRTLLWHISAIFSHFNAWHIKLHLVVALLVHSCGRTADSGLLHLYVKWQSVVVVRRQGSFCLSYIFFLKVTE